MQIADIDKTTGHIRKSGKNEIPRWKFMWFMPTLDAMLQMYIEECTPVADESLADASLICQTIRDEYAKLQQTLLGTKGDDAY